MTQATGRSDADVGFSAEDHAYIRANFVTLEEACRDRGDRPDEVRALIHERKLPLPAYVLDNGSEMVGADFFALVDEAGGVASLREHFVERYRRAAAAHDDPVSDAAVEEEWQAYLSGDYAVCLHRVTPEGVYRKSWLMAEIERLLAEAQPDQLQWRARLAAYVDELDALEREFAPYDRRRWGAVSRDRLITAVRRRYNLKSGTGGQP